MFTLCPDLLVQIALFHAEGATAADEVLGITTGWRRYLGEVNMHLRRRFLAEETRRERLEPSLNENEMVWVPEVVQNIHLDLPQYQPESPIGAEELQENVRRMLDTEVHELQMEA